MVEQAHLTGLGVTLELAGEVPDYFLDYLSRYYQPHYQVERRPVVVGGTPRVTLDLDGAELSRWRARRGRGLGRVAVDPFLCGSVVEYDDESRAMFADGGSFAVVQTPGGDLLLAADEPTPATLARLAVRINVVLLSLCVAARSLVPLHSAAVQVNGSGVLLAGRKTAGKTSLALALATRGARFLSNELTLVGRRDDGALYVLGNSLPLRLGAGTLRAHPSLLDSLDPYLTRQVQLAPSDWYAPPEYKVELSLGSIARTLDLVVAFESPLDAVIWPNVSGGEGVVVELLDGQRARDRIAATTLTFDTHWHTWGTTEFNGLPPLDPAQVRTLDAVADLPHYRALGARRPENLTNLVLALFD